MVHTFDSKIATRYGVNAAILLQNLFYWIDKNRANEKHFHDGYYWTYNSIKAFEEMFPYMSAKQIRSALEKLENKGIIVSGNYNSSTYDRTKWYAITEEGYKLFDCGTCICQKGKMDLTEKSNQFDREGEPIPDINTDIKPDNITVSNDTVRQTEVRRCVDEWNRLQGLGIKPVSRLASGTKRYDSLVARIKQYGIDDVLVAIEKIKQSSFLQGRGGGKRQWMITFDWFVLPNNFPKVLDGNYDDVDVGGQSPIEDGNGGWQ
ncbi:hypothetical protein [Faecalicatena contorta]|uniref:hypothetical protein n=1 Tax=Faecalicatena contorta TaxID=39482 RepID=UPI0032178F8D